MLSAGRVEIAVDAADAGDVVKARHDALAGGHGLQLLGVAEAGGIVPAGADRHPAIGVPEGEALGKTSPYCPEGFAPSRCQLRTLR